MTSGATLGSAYNNLGIVLDNLDRDDEALAALQRGLELRTEALGASHPEVAASHYGIATLHIDAGAIDLAKASLSAAEAIYDRQEESSLPAMELLNVRGILAAESGDLDEALVRFEAALAAGERAVGTESSLLSPVLNGLGRVLGMLGRHEDAVRHIERSIRIVAAEHGPDYAPLAYDHLALGTVLSRIGQLDAARKHYQRALDLNASPGLNADAKRSLESVAARIQGDPPLPSGE